MRQDLVVALHRQLAHYLLGTSGPQHAEPCPPASPAPRRLQRCLWKSSKRGKIFYSCSNYPQCDYARGTGPSPSPAPNALSLLVMKIPRPRQVHACPESIREYTRPSKAATRTTRNSFRLTGIRAGDGRCGAFTPALSNTSIRKTLLSGGPSVSPSDRHSAFIQRITYITGEISRESAFRDRFSPLSGIAFRRFGQVMQFILITKDMPNLQPQPACPALSHAERAAVI